MIIFLIFLLLGIALISILFVDDIFITIMITSFISALCSISYILLDAIDVAMTEVVVGVGISTILMLVTLHLTKSYSVDKKYIAQRFSRISPFNIFNSVLLLVIFFIFIDGLAYAPIFQDPSSPANSSNIYNLYMNINELFHVPNAVTMILGSYRGFDTLGETTVVLIAAIGVYLVLQKIDDKNLSPTSKESINENLLHKNNSVLISAVFSLIPVSLLFGFYVQFHADFGPGGGFQAGVIIASIYIFTMLYFGKITANKFLNIDCLIILLGIGTLIFGGVGIITLMLGGAYLDYIVFGYNQHHAYHYGLLLVELGVGVTVFAATATIISQFYNKLNN